MVLQDQDWTHLHKALKADNEYDGIQCGEPKLRAVTKIKLYIPAFINICISNLVRLTITPIMNMLKWLVCGSCPK